MLAKEWRDARWKFLLGAAAVLVLLVVLPRSYAEIREDIAFQIKMMRGEMESSGEFPPPMSDQERERYIAETRDQVREMRSPEYALDMARMEMYDLHTSISLFVLIPLAALLGGGLISGEVGRNSIFLLLSKPVSRNRILLIKCAVCVACLLAVAVLASVGIILSVRALGYPPEVLDIGQVFVSGALIWLGSLFVLGVAMVASVVFGDVLRSLVATVAAMFAILAGPDLIRAFVEWIVWGDRVYTMDLRTLPDWYRAFDWFSLSTYWLAQRPYSPETIVGQSFLVCTETAAGVLLIAFWLFGRKAY